MVSAGRKIFDGQEASVRVIFVDSSEAERIGDFYFLKNGVRLPTKMIERISSPDGFIFTPDCSLRECTVLNEIGEESIMIQGSDVDGASEVLIPCRFLNTIVEPSRKAHPQEWK